VIIRHWTHDQANMLTRLNIGRDNPWVWISSEGPISEANAAPRLHVDGPEGTPSTCPFPYLWSKEWAKKWNGYSVLLVGLLTTIEIHNFRNQYGTFGGSTGVPWSWEEDGRTFAVDLYYQKTHHQDSQLYAEVLNGPPGSDAAIRQAHLDHKTPARKLAWRGMDLLLQGPHPGRPARPKRDSDTEYWLGRIAAHGGVKVGDPGEHAARAEYYDATPRSSDRYDWWDDHILRTLRRRQKPPPKP
jgi:hypothetical protein